MSSDKQAECWSSVKARMNGSESRGWVESRGSSGALTRGSRDAIFILKSIQTMSELLKSHVKHTVHV
jgi:hypothetical protein